MKQGIASDTKRSAKTLAQQIARQLRDEPGEILKEGGREISGTGEPARAETQSSQEEIRLREAKDKAQSKRQIDALTHELKEIEVLNKQKESERLAPPAPVKVEKPVLEPSTKKSRRLLGFGQKAAAEKQKTRVEKILPPTG